MISSDFFDREEKLIANNKKAEHEFFIVQRFEAGIQLQGTEVKSLRSGKCSVQEAYCSFKSKNSYELFVYNLHVPEYSHGNIENHNPKRARKLLVQRREAIKIKQAVQEKGMTIVPLRVYFSGHLVKIEIGLVRAKKKYDKRETEKRKDAEREIKKTFKVR